MRIGHGYDAHRLKEGRPCILCGILIPSPVGPDGHSDADVPAHALIDAVFGALCLPDIGAHFPDSDSAYKDADSMELLRLAGEEMRKNGYEIENADITLIAQRPKLAPYIGRMKIRLEEVLEASPGSVNVKATTEEGMGFTGSGEGIAAHAVVLLREV
ncbi:MAG: 2-C-methyl-D-erythritol 2,4-cyclodiphosphate synthase [Oscillospiraceae bacterium]|nr:2-C-methyl-D-erythritol 2,4-cyclodiphosphate synthase [Oscillospiraceae bacterium]